MEKEKNRNNHEEISNDEAIRMAAQKVIELNNDPEFIAKLIAREKKKRELLEQGRFKEYEDLLEEATVRLTICVRERK